MEINEFVNNNNIEEIFDELDKKIFLENNKIFTTRKKNSTT